MSKSEPRATETTLLRRPGSLRSIPVRTTLNLDPSLIGELRRRGERDHKSLGELASQVLARSLRQENETDPPTFSWVSGELDGPAVDSGTRTRNSLLDQ